MGVYPFMFGAVKDFEPVVEDLVIVRQTLSVPDDAWGELKCWSSLRRRI